MYSASQELQRMKRVYMKAIPAILFVLLVSAVTSGSIEIFSEAACPVGMTWNPVRIDGCKQRESGGMRILVSRGFPFDTESWTIDIDSDGNFLYCGEVEPGHQLTFSTSPIGPPREMWLIACTEEGDTVWSCILEGTDADFYNAPLITELADGGYLIDSPPDCNTIYTEIQSISSTGEMIWHHSLGTDYLLDLDEPVGETCASVASIRETSSGDILICGSVAQWFTSQDAWFVCLLDGDTGIPLRKTTGYALGEARVFDVAETWEGFFVAVGETSECVVPEGMVYSVWGPKQPFIAVLDDDGTLIDLEVFELDAADSFEALVEYESGRDYMYDSVAPPSDFIVAGVDTTSSELVIVRVRMSME
jgi:hypothetical protein